MHYYYDQKKSNKIISSFKVYFVFYSILKGKVPFYSLQKVADR